MEPFKDCDCKGEGCDIKPETCVKDCGVCRGDKCHYIHEPDQKPNCETHPDLCDKPKCEGTCEEK